MTNTTITHSNMNTPKIWSASTRVTTEGKNLIMKSSQSSIRLSEVSTYSVTPIDSEVYQEHIHHC